MATVAVGAVVDVIPNAAVFGRHLVRWMAAGCAAENRVVRRVGVARKAGDPFVRAAGDGEPCVVEGRSGPLGRRVASGACGREARCFVIRIRRRIVDGGVAAVAILRRAFVYSVHMAGSAGNGCVFAG